LDSDKPVIIKEPTRINRIARGSGRSMKEVSDLLEQHKQFAKMVDKMKVFSKGGMRGNNIQKMASVVPPHIMKQMGGMYFLRGLLSSVIRL
jgi:signal recognition particle subunit SRP54